MTPPPSANFLKSCLTRLIIFLVFFFFFFLFLSWLLNFTFPHSVHNAYAANGSYFLSSCFLPKASPIPPYLQRRAFGGQPLMRWPLSDNWLAHACQCPMYLAPLKRVVGTWRSTVAWPAPPAASRLDAVTWSLKAGPGAGAREVRSSSCPPVFRPTLHADGAIHNHLHWASDVAAEGGGEPAASCGTCGEGPSIVPFTSGSRWPSSVLDGPCACTAGLRP
ncbi:hypothetical protein J3F84DRAFT_318227 [Trichoderma pleuroticola]